MTLRWMDRKFEFTTPVEQFPTVLERLRGTPARVEEKVRGLSSAVLTRRDGEAWSIQEHLGHRNASSTAIYARISDRNRERLFAVLDQSSDIVHPSTTVQAQREPCEGGGSA